MATGGGAAPRVLPFELGSMNLNTAWTKRGPCFRVGMTLQGAGSMSYPPIETEAALAGNE